MTRTVKNGELREIAMHLSEIWQNNSKEIKLSGKEMLNIVKLKKELIEKGSDIVDAFIEVGVNAGGEPDEKGQLKIPEDKVFEVNRALNDIAFATTEIVYTPVKIDDKAFIPVEILDLFCDLCEIE